MSTATQIGPIRRAWYQWKALRFPWRKQFLVGLDLQGNTYWEFRLSRGDPSAPDSRFRRIVKYPRASHLSDVAVPPQWHQWLRHQRQRAPTIQELNSDVARRERMKVLAADADARWEAKPSFLDAPGKERGQPVPPLNTARTMQLPSQEERAAAPESATRNAAQRETPPGKEDPWKRAKATAPGETWQPEAWSPTSTKKR